jgi:hypothetical protein
VNIAFAAARSGLVETAVTCLWRAAAAARNARHSGEREFAVTTLTMIAQSSPHAKVRRLAGTVLESIAHRPWPAVAASEGEQPCAS